MSGRGRGGPEKASSTSLPMASGDVPPRSKVSDSVADRMAAAMALDMLGFFLLLGGRGVFSGGLWSRLGGWPFWFPGGGKGGGGGGRKRLNVLAGPCSLASAGRGERAGACRMKRA